MANSPVSLLIPAETRAAIDAVVRRTGRDFSNVANEMLTEAVKMRRIPGIVFADSPNEIEAAIADNASWTPDRI
jgi:antitoxin component of RelBE/YafQ-DinJ toxin-antitoxin module